MSVKGTGDKTTDGCTTPYYQCNRTALALAFDPPFPVQRDWKKEDQKPRLFQNKQPHRTAAITLTANHTMQSVKAEVCHVHYEHQARLGHFRLGAKDRLQIAGILAQGVTWDKILDDVCTSVSDKRILLLQQKQA